MSTHDKTDAFSTVLLLERLNEKFIEAIEAIEAEKVQHREENPGLDHWQKVCNPSDDAQRSRIEKLRKQHLPLFIEDLITILQAEIYRQLSSGPYRRTEYVEVTAAIQEDGGGYYTSYEWQPAKLPVGLIVPRSMLFPEGVAVDQVKQVVEGLIKESIDNHRTPPVLVSVCQYQGYREAISQCPPGAHSYDGPYSSGCTHVSYKVHRCEYISVTLCVMVKDMCQYP